MKRSSGTIFAGLAGIVTAIAVAVPSQAQSGRQPARGRGQSSQPQVIPPGSSILVPVPSRTIWNPAEELVEREFQYMRSTARDPDKFLYGRYNPRYQVVTPQNGRPQYGFPTLPYGYGGYYGGNYGGYYYGSVQLQNPNLGLRLGTGFGGYGYGGSLQQREVIILRDGTRDPGPGTQEVPSDRARTESRSDSRGEPRSEPRKESVKESVKEDFYLGEKGKSEALPDALDDIRKAWLNGDFERIQARFKSDGAVGIYPKGKFKYAVSSAEFLNVLKGAMTRLDTVAFDFDRPKSEEAGRVLVTGKHVFLDTEKKRVETYVSYGLKRVDGKWLITEAGSSASPILKHEE